MACRMISPAFCLVLLCVAAGYPAAGQSYAHVPTASSLTPWKASDEIRLGGVIREVLAKNPAGAPSGVNLLMTGSQNVLNVSVGPHLDKNTRKALQPGESIEVVGIVRSIQGQDYLLAREMILGGETIAIRSKDGFPIRDTARGTVPAQRSLGGSNGGAR